MIISSFTIILTGQLIKIEWIYDITFVTTLHYYIPPPLIHAHDVPSGFLRIFMTIPKNDLLPKSRNLIISANNTPHKLPTERMSLICLFEYTWSITTCLLLETWKSFIQMLLLIKHELVRHQKAPAVSISQTPIQQKCISSQALLAHCSSALIVFIFVPSTACRLHDFFLY